MAFVPNGRINLTNPRSCASGPVDQLPGFGYRTEVGASEADDAIRGNWESTPLNRAYFSPANVTIIQNKIRREVFDRSKGAFLIDPQKAEELLTVMRGIYLEYGRNLPFNIPDQIAELNQMVTDKCVPDILSAIHMDKFYLKDIQTAPVPLPMPEFMSSKGHKTQSLTRFF